MANSMSERARRRMTEQVRAQLSHPVGEAMTAQRPELETDPAKRSTLVHELIEKMTEMNHPLSVEDQFDILARAVVDMYKRRNDHCAPSIVTMMVRVQQAGVELDKYLEEDQ